MDDALLVGGGQGLGERRAAISRIRSSGSPPSGIDAVEGLALDELHGEEVDAVRLLDGVDGDDPGVVEGGQRLGLAPEALEPLRARGHLGGQHLERHVATELRVGGAVDLAHPAGADGGGDAVVGEGRADQGRAPLGLGAWTNVLESGDVGCWVDSTAARRPAARRRRPDARPSRPRGRNRELLAELSRAAGDGVEKRSIYIVNRYNELMEILTHETAVILALGRGPTSGVQIMERLREEGLGGRPPGPGTLYPLLRRLEEAGLVRSWIEKRRSSVGRPRRFQELTASGLGALDRVRQQLRAIERESGPTRRQVSTVRRMRANLRRAFRASSFALRLRDARMS